MKVAIMMHHTPSGFKDKACMAHSNINCNDSNEGGLGLVTQVKLFRHWIQGRGCDAHVVEGTQQNVIESDAKDINQEFSVASKAFDEGPWPKMTTYVTISYCASYLSL